MANNTNTNNLCSQYPLTVETICGAKNQSKSFDRSDRLVKKMDGGTAQSNQRMAEHKSKGKRKKKKKRPRKKDDEDMWFEPASTLTTTTTASQLVSV
jgi:hypothetical protein